MLSISFDSFDISNTENRFIHYGKILKPASIRPYLNDYKRFHTVFGIQNVVTQVTKASVVTLSLFTLELQLHDMKNMKNETDEEFDWDLAYPKYMNLFIDKSVAFLTTSLIKKMYELWALFNLPTKLADKLTKDLALSTSRKLSRTKYFSLNWAIFQSALYSNFLMYLSSFTYDVIYNGIKVITDKKYKNIQYYTIWFLKKGCLFTVCWISASYGHTLGCRVLPYAGGTIGTLIFEGVAGSVATSVLGISM